jgi:hypothetical protein
LLLLVEEKRPRWFKRDEFKLRWRGAKLLDLAEIPLQPLVDLGRISRPTYSNRPTGLRVVEPSSAQKAS